jgi:uncharacterized protein YneF (UPF0154 family)
MELNPYSTALIIIILVLLVATSMVVFVVLGSYIDTRVVQGHE